MGIGHLINIQQQATARREWQGEKGAGLDDASRGKSHLAHFGMKAFKPG